MIAQPAICWTTSCAPAKNLECLHRQKNTSNDLHVEILLRDIPKVDCHVLIELNTHVVLAKFLCLRMDEGVVRFIFGKEPCALPQPQKNLVKLTKVNDLSNKHSHYTVRCHACEQAEENLQYQVLHIYSVTHVCERQGQNEQSLWTATKKHIIMTNHMLCCGARRIFPCRTKHFSRTCRPICRRMQRLWAILVLRPVHVVGTGMQSRRKSNTARYLLQA